MSKQHSPRFRNICEKACKQVNEINVDELKKWLDTHPDNFVLIDVREQNEWDQGHLPQAIHLSKGVIERDIEAIIPKENTKIALYCGGGFRSALAALNLKQMGYHNVFSVMGGYRGWCEKAFPTKKD